MDDQLEYTLEAPPRRGEHGMDRPPGPKRAQDPALTPAIALLPLRLFLGVTFVYAGIQKLSDPGFLHDGARTYIGTQLTGFANHTPGGFILRTFAIPHAELAGIGVAVFEILIGLLVTFGLFTRPAAACGLALNLLLFFTASWHTSPYFLGPDIVFAFAWLPFVLAGAEGQPALDNLPRATTAPATASNGNAPALPLTRRALLGEMAAAALALSGIAALLKGSYKAPALASGKSTGAGSGSAPGPRPASIPANAVEISDSSQIPSGHAVEYTDPVDGSIDLVVRQSDGSLRAFSSVCTHAGCSVNYQGGEIVCPCHQGVFNAETGAVESGPPPAPLPKKKVVEAAGKIYAVPS